jgi:hypothetical protein
VTLKAGTNVPLSLLGFSAATTQSIYFKLFPASYGSGNITVKIELESDAGRTIGAVVFGVALVAVAPGSSTNVETMALAAQVTATETVNANAHGLTETIIAISGASLSTIAAGTTVWLQIQRVTRIYCGQRSSGRKRSEGTTMTMGFAIGTLIGPRGPGPTFDQAVLNPEEGQPLSSGAFPTFTNKQGTTVPLSLLGYAKGQSSFWKFFPYTYPVTNPNLTVRIEWESDTGQTSGAVVWGAALVAVVPGSATNVETMALAAQLTTTTTVSATAHGLNETIITVSGASLSSLAAGDLVFLQIQRTSSGSDTMTGNANLLLAVVQWSLS